MNKFICKRCQKEFHSYDSLKRHSSRVHKVSGQDFYVEFYLNGKRPTCECGCGQFTSWQGHNSGGFSKFVKGHYAKKIGGFNTPKGIAKSVEVRKEKWKKGEMPDVWNKGKKWDECYTPKQQEELLKTLKSEVRRKKISDSNKGKPKSAEHKKKIGERSKKDWSNPKYKQMMREKRMDYMRNRLRKSNSLLERRFIKILKQLKIDYYFQYSVDSYFYDFKIKGTNILIEVDGDFYHGNKKVHEIKYPIQLHTIEHDKIKNKVAKENGYNLLRFWESDINNHPAKITKILLDNIY